MDIQKWEAAIESLNIALERAERRMVQHYRSSCQIQSKSGLVIWYMKLGNRWGIYIDAQPVDKCSVEQRVEVALSLDLLEESLKQEWDRRFAEVERATQVALEFSMRS
jgi:hypothetical protein